MFGMRRTRDNHEKRKHMISDYCPCCGTKMDARVRKGDIIYDEILIK